MSTCTREGERERKKERAREREGEREKKRLLFTIFCCVVVTVGE
jgi:hypothetical protein